MLEKVIVCSIFYGFLQLSLFICIKSFKDCICEVSSKIVLVKGSCVCIYQQLSFENKLLIWPLRMQMALPLGSCFRKLCQLYTSLGLLILVCSGRAI